MQLPLEEDLEYVPPQEPTQGAVLRTNTAHIAGSLVAAGAKVSLGREEGDTVDTKGESTTEKYHSESPIVTEEQPSPEGRPESVA